VPSGHRRIHHAAGRFPLPTTEEWGEGKGEGFAAPIRWKLPLSPALSPLVPRRERERGASAMVVVFKIPQRTPARSGEAYDFRQAKSTATWQKTCF